MLEFNNEHKKVDLSQIDMKNGKYKKSGKIMLGGILLSAVVFFSGCGLIADKDSTTNLDRAMIYIDDECVAFDIDDYTRWSGSNTELELTDGTTLHVHPSELSLYNKKSESMRNIEESISPIYISDVDEHIGNDVIDRAFVKVNNVQTVLEIIDYTRWSDSSIELKLVDGSTLALHPMDVMLFSSKSPVMSQIQDEVLDNNNKKTR